MDTYPTLVQRLTQRAAKQHVLGVIGHTLFVGSGGQRREILVQGLASGQVFRESGMPCLNQKKKEALDHARRHCSHTSKKTLEKTWINANTVIQACLFMRWSERYTTSTTSTTNM